MKTITDRYLRLSITLSVASMLCLCVDSAAEFGMFTVTQWAGLGLAGAAFVALGAHIRREIKAGA